MNANDIFVVGVNHLQTTISRREKAAVSLQNLPEALHQIRNDGDIDEAVILSTCSRTEVYCAAEDPLAASGAVCEWFRRRVGPEISAVIYIHSGLDAIRHLCRIASGLDSWIIGESEILSQVKRAYQTALEADTTGHILNRTFQKAIAAGKTIRTQTGIQNGIHSVGGAAALLTRKIFGMNLGAEILVIGAGQAAEAVTRHLVAKNFSRILVANRTIEHAKPFAEKLGGEVIGLAEAMNRLSTVDLAVFSVSSPEPILTLEKLRPILLSRKRPLFLLDLGLPRNVEPTCGDFDGAYLYGLDDLRGMVHESLDKKSFQKEEAEVLASVAAGECCDALNKAAKIAGEMVEATG